VCGVNNYHYQPVALQQIDYKLTIADLTTIDISFFVDTHLGLVSDSRSGLYMVTKRRCEEEQAVPHSTRLVTNYILLVVDSLVCRVNSVKITSV